LLVVLLIAALACNLPGNVPNGGQSDEIDHPEVDTLMEEVGISLDEVMAAPSIDERPETLELLGAPDAFTLQWQELQGQSVRWEEWSYYDFESRFDFVDGVLLWTLDIEPAPSGSIYAHAYNPLEFEAGMTIAEVQDMLPDMVMTEFPLDEVDVPEGLLFTGDPILLGFDEGGLVYVQTFILEPEGSLELQEETIESPEPLAGVPAPTQPPGLLLLDTFDLTSQTAVPFFGPDYMEFTIGDGIGVLTAHHPGILVAKYDTPIVQDFAATLVLWTPNPQPDAGYGLLFRGQADEGGIPEYYVMFAEPAGGKLRLQRWVADGIVDVAEAQLPDTLDAPFMLYIQATGSTIYAEINDKPTLLVEDSALIEPGIFGLAIYSPTDDDYVLFEELQVEALDD
jgi:hypothetical protein